MFSSHLHRPSYSCPNPSHPPSFFHILSLLGINFTFLVLAVLSHNIMQLIITPQMKNFHQEPRRRRGCLVHLLPSHSNNNKYGVGYKFAVDFYCILNLFSFKTWQASIESMNVSWKQLMLWIYGQSFRCRQSSIYKISWFIVGHFPPQISRNRE